MRIAIDGRTIVDQRTGVGTYAERIIRSLTRIDTQNEYLLFLVEPNPQLAAPQLQSILIPGYDKIGRNRWWENMMLPAFLRKNAVDILFSPAYALPLFRKPSATRYVVTIHDLIAFVHPESFTPKMRLWQKLFVRNAARMADRVIAVSHRTKDDLLRFTSLQSERISVIHNAVDDVFHPIRDAAALENVRRQYNLPGEFILHVGTIEPRKNLVALVQSYALLPNHLRDRYALVLAGGKGWYDKHIIADIERSGLHERVHFTGFVEHNDLPALYALATLFVYPSLYEGFGYPPLEAMACGTPVITSNRSSLPEVTGEAALLVDPKNTHEIAQAMTSLLTDEQQREDLRERGLKRAAEFRWDQCARNTLRVFEEVVRS